MSSNQNIDVKALMNFLKIVLYLVFFLHLMTCFFWVTIAQNGPDQFHYDSKIDRYVSSSSHHNDESYLKKSDGSFETKEANKFFDNETSKDQFYFILPGE